MGNKKGRRQVTGLRGHLKRHFLQRNFLYSKNQFRFSPQALENRHCNIALRNFSVLNECRHILAPNAMTSEAHVCRLILTPHLFITFLNSARFCSKPSSLFWMSKNQSLPWLFEFGLWTVAMRRWCLRVQLTWWPLQRQRGLCGAGTRLCNEPPTTACPGGGKQTCRETLQLFVLEHLLWEGLPCCSFGADPWPFNKCGQFLGKKHLTG